MISGLQSAKTSTQESEPEKNMCGQRTQVRRRVKKAALTISNESIRAGSPCACAIKGYDVGRGNPVIKVSIYERKQQRALVKNNLSCEICLTAEGRCGLPMIIYFSRQCLPRLYYGRENFSDVGEQPPVPKAQRPFRAVTSNLYSMRGETDLC